MGYERAVNLLKNLISTPSISKDEGNTATLLFDEMLRRGYTPNRELNNVWAYNKFFDPELNTIVLCAHHDTVAPNQGYTRDPFEPTEEDGKLYGLGSNDDGASLVSLMEVFDHYYAVEGLGVNLCLLLTAEEESSGVKGMEIMFPLIHKPELVVVGEPTSMNLAIAERGLMVLDCEVEGIPGHAAHENTVNPIYLAINDINWFREYEFQNVSEVLGKVKMSVTVISAGREHNVVPNFCKFTVDVRSNGLYSNQEILDVVRKNVKAKVTPRSLRLNPSSISVDHPFVQACVENGATTYGSPTLSDQALVKCDSLKIGVGDTERSHNKDEFVYLWQIQEGIEKYLSIFDTYFNNKGRTILNNTSNK